jgi:hypothetical protein
MLNRGDVLLCDLQRLGGDHCDLIGIETFDEVKLEDVALASRLILDGPSEGVPGGPSPPQRSTTRPSNCCCKSAKSFAMISITFNSSALSTGIDALSRTADLAHSTLGVFD